MKPGGTYTCLEYREEMTLLGLKRRLENPELSEAEKDWITKEIKKLEKHMRMD